MTKTCILIGAPIDAGQKRAGCLMGPSAYRVAGLGLSITDLGHRVEDWGDVALPTLEDAHCPNPAVHSLAEVIGWTKALCDRTEAALQAGGFPILLGGDHSLALGSVAGAAGVPSAAGSARSLDSRKASQNPASVLCQNALWGLPCMHRASAVESQVVQGWPNVANIAGQNGYRS